MCGLIAYIGTLKNSFSFIYNGLELLQNRGYDSAGICTIHYNSIENQYKFQLSKYANTTNSSSLELLKETNNIHDNSQIGIGHTRWATHGKKTDTNAHPHQDNNQQIYLSHNGIIENYIELKEMLIDIGYTFYSDTDTEVIANLISYYLTSMENNKENSSMENSSMENSSMENSNMENSSMEDSNMNKVLTKLNETLVGTWALTILYLNQPDTLYLTKKGSPLLVGYNDSYAIIASESIGFYNHISEFFIMDDGDIVSIKLLEHRIQINKPKEYEICKVIKSTIEKQPYPFQHWTIKEIMEQPMSTLRAMNMGNRIKNEHMVNLAGLDNHKQQLLEIDNLLIVSSGTSLHAGLIGSIYMKMLKSIDNINIIEASEFCEYDIPNHGNTGLLVLSQSGETRDVYRAMEIAKSKNIFIISIVNVVNSLIAREADCGIYINCGRENGVASTKSFTSQVVATALLSIYLSQSKHEIDTMTIRKQIIRSILDLPLDIENCLKIFDDCKLLIPELINKNSCFILGRKLCEPIAKEGALKMKELSYIHAEGYPSGSLKHGPFALIEEGTPIFILSPDMDSDDRCYSLAEEVKSRGALTILITNCTEVRRELFDYIINIPYNKYFGNLLANIPLQIIAYELSIAKNINPDRPRNLAKVVTVDG